jgi:MFS family permease
MLSVSMTGDKYRWVILILAYLCMLGFAFTFQSLPPVLPLITEELRLTHAEAGLLMGLFSLPAIFLSIVTGLLSDRLGPFKIGLFSLILMVSGALIFAFSGTFVYAGLGRFIGGLGAATISIVAAQILSLWFRGREAGTAMGILNTAMPVGTILCFTIFGRLGEGLGWRVPIFFTATIGVMVLAAFLLLYKPAPNPPQETFVEKTGLFSSLLKVEVSVWLIGFCWMWFNAALISFSTFAPDFFISKGYSIGSAGLLASLLMWGSLGLSPIIGRLVDKVGNNEVFIGLGGIILATAIYFVSQSTDFLFSMIIMGVAVAFIPVPVFDFPSKVLKSEHLGLGFGILSATSSIGVLIGPYMAGLVRDKTGSYETSFMLLSFFAILVTITAIVLRARPRFDN